MPDANAKEKLKEDSPEVSALKKETYIRQHEHQFSTGDIELKDALLTEGFSVNGIVTDPKTKKKMFFFAEDKAVIEDLIRKRKEEANNEST
jgi:hypothetical protein